MLILTRKKLLYYFLTFLACWGFLILFFSLFRSTVLVDELMGKNDTFYWNEEEMFVVLSNGIKMPIIGYGTAGLRKPATSIKLADEAGYRMFDTASNTASWYKTEGFVGEILRKRGRKNIFVITKLHPQDHGTKSATESIEKSLSALSTNYIDLYLIHFPRCWPDICPKLPEGTWQDSWRVMEKYYKKGVLKALGVSNFRIADLKELWDFAEVKPMVVEDWLDPYHRDEVVIEFCKSNKMQFIAYSSLGSQWMMKYGNNPVLNSEELGRIAIRKGKTVSQIVLRWLIHAKIVVIPKSENEDHILQNLDIFSFHLTEDEINSINKLKNTTIKN